MGNALAWLATKTEGSPRVWILTRDARLASSKMAVRVMSKFRYFPAPISLQTTRVHIVPLLSVIVAGAIRLNIAPLLPEAAAGAAWTIRYNLKLGPFISC